MKKPLTLRFFKLITVSLILILVSSLTIHIAKASSIRIKLSLNMYNSDETLLFFEPNGLSKFSSAEDALKFFNPTVNIYSKSTDNHSLAINTFPDFINNHTTQLTITGQTNGDYNLLFTEILDFDTLMNISLFDSFTSTTTTITDSTIVSFSINSNPASQGAGRFQLNFQSSSPLPVSWLSFNGERVEKLTKLNWSTASEKNSSYFTVQKSINGVEFSNIGQVKAANFSSQVSNYSFNDLTNGTSSSYYRIMEVDMNGSFSYSKIIYINQISANTISLYPNPANSTIYIDNTSEETLEIEFLNTSGKKVQNQLLVAGTNSISIEDLPVGVYIFHSKMKNSNTISTGKFIKQ